jgi:hypothetical protein
MDSEGIVADLRILFATMADRPWSGMMGKTGKRNVSSAGEW